MDGATLETVARIAALFCGVLFGSYAIGTATWVWGRKQIFHWGGAVLSLVGLVLLGFSIYTTVKFGAGPVSFEAQANLTRTVTDAAGAQHQFAEKAQILEAAAKAGDSAKAAQAAADAATAAKEAVLANNRALGTIYTVTQPLTPNGLRLDANGNLTGATSLMSPYTSTGEALLGTKSGSPISDSPTATDLMKLPLKTVPLGTPIVPSEQK